MIHDGLEGHCGHDHRLSTCASAASAAGSQHVMTIAWDIAMAVGNSVRACSCWPSVAYSMPRPPAWRPDDADHGRQ